jgi:hypothetical protein
VPEYILSIGIEDVDGLVNYLAPSIQSQIFTLKTVAALGEAAASDEPLALEWALEARM